MEQQHKISTPYVNYRKNDPFLRPNWRFERVLELVDRQPTPGRTTRFDDEYIRQARSFILRWRVANSNARQRLWADNPDLAGAYAIYEKINSDPETQFMLEARLLANQDDKEIAFALKTSVETIQWYEALFFNVKEFLQHHDWIMKHVLLPASDRMATTDDEDDDDLTTRFVAKPVIKPHLDMTLKYFAYFGGPLLCEFMISGFKRGQILRNQDDIDSFMDSQFGSNIRRVSASASSVFEVNKYNVMELFATHTKIMELHQRQDSSEDKRSAIERHIHAMLTEIPWTVGSGAKEIFEGTVIGEYDEMAAELRDEELMLITAGEQPAGVVEVNGLVIPKNRVPDKEVKQ